MVVVGVLLWADGGEDRCAPSLTFWLLKSTLELRRKPWGKVERGEGGNHLNDSEEFSTKQAD